MLLYPIFSRVCVDLGQSDWTLFPNRLLSHPWSNVWGKMAGERSIWITSVWISSLPVQSSVNPSQETPWLASERYATVATRTELQVPIESVPIGARIPTKNPNRWEVDPQPEPDQATWAKLSITAEGSDGGIVDAEIIRPRSWILRNGICAGRMLPFNLPEIEVSGLALVTAIDDCPQIADGEGSVVTARFVTRQVHVVASVDVLGADGTVETISVRITSASLQSLKATMTPA